METQQTNVIIEPTHAIEATQESYLAQRVRFYKQKLDAICFKMDNFQAITSDEEIDLLWLYRADRLWDDGKFDAEIEAFRFDPKPVKKYNKRGGGKTNGAKKSSPKRYKPKKV